MQRGQVSRLILRIQAELFISERQSFLQVVSLEIDKRELGIRFRIVRIPFQFQPLTASDLPQLQAFFPSQGQTFLDRTLGQSPLAYEVTLEINKCDCRNPWTSRYICCRQRDYRGRLQCQFSNLQFFDTSALFHFEM